MDNVRLYGMPTTSFEKILLWKVEEILLWKVIRYSCQFFYFLFYISFYISRYHFYNFLEFVKLSENFFSPKSFFFNRFTPSPQPESLIDHNLLNMTKVFCRFSLKCFLKYFFSNSFLTKSCNSFFKGLNYRFFGLLFKT